MNSDMESGDYLNYLVREIHTTVVATVDDDDLPVTAAIDMMDADGSGVYFLTANPVQYLATVGRDGKAKCRPFMFCFEQDGKLWFCTNNQKDVYKDMQANPYVEVSVSSPSYAWIRLHGKAVFENNMAVKEGCMNNPIVKGQYQTANNPIFEVFYLEEPHGVIADFSGNLPYEF